LATGSAQGDRRPVYCVDLWSTGTFEEGTRRFYQFDPSKGEQQRHSKFSRPLAINTFNERRFLFDHGQLIRPIVGQTTDVARYFPHPIGLLFIDADHLYEAVKADFGAWAPKVVSGGIVAFHDYKELDRGEGVKRFVDELLANDTSWTEIASVGSLFAIRRS
jgi:hypothetical protein